METIRVRVLAACAVAAVLTFLLAPSAGLFARVPLMVLIGVLALIWHLVVSGRSAVTPATPGVEPLEGTGSAPTPTDESADDSVVVDLTDGAAELELDGPRPGYFDLTPPRSSDRPTAPEMPTVVTVVETEIAPTTEPVSSDRLTVTVDEPPPFAADAPVQADWPPARVEVPRVFTAGPSPDDQLEVPSRAVDAESPVGREHLGAGADPWLSWAASMFATAGDESPVDRD